MRRVSEPKTKMALSVPSDSPREPHPLKHGNDFWLAALFRSFPLFHRGVSPVRRVGHRRSGRVPVGCAAGRVDVSSLSPSRPLHGVSWGSSMRIGQYVVLAVLLSHGSNAAAQGAFPATFEIAGPRLAIEAAKLSPGVFASEGDPLMLPTADGRKAADIATYAAIGVEGGLWVNDWWHGPERQRSAWCKAGEIGLMFGATEVLKRVTKRERPNGRDDKSFPSQHTGLAVLLSPEGWSQLLWGGGVGIGRMLAGEHHATDVLAGGGIAYAITFIPCQ